MALEAGGYRALALPLAHSALARFVYCKKHAARKVAEGSEAQEDARLAPGRTVYLVNLPLAATDAWLRRALAGFGAVQSVEFGAEGGEKAADVGRTAHVVFKAEGAVQKLLGADRLEVELPEGPSGIQAYMARYRARKPGLAAVKEIADKHMGEFDAMEEEVRWLCWL